MNHSIKVGLSFGLTSGVITTLGLMVGLEAGTSSRLAVIGGIITIAIADAASDAMGIHVAEESENIHTWKEIWTSTISTFLAKSLFALIFVIPILSLELQTAILINIAIGLLIISITSYIMAIRQKKSPWLAIVEHAGIAIIVIAVTHLLGKWVAVNFG